MKQARIYSVVARAIMIAFFLLCSSVVFASDEDSFLQSFTHFIDKQAASNSDGAYDGEVRGFYKIRQYKPVWIDAEAKVRPETLAFISSLQAAIEEHGLESSDYPFKLLETHLSNHEMQGTFAVEWLVTSALVRLAHDLQGGRVNLSQLYVGWEFARPQVNLIQDLAKAVEENQLNSFLTKLCPQSADYWALVSALKTYQQFSHQGGWQTVSAGVTIKDGMKDSRVPLIKDRLKAEGYAVSDSDPATDPDIYTPEVHQTVADYQSRNTLDVDGFVGGKTLQSLNKSAQTKVRQIKANMLRMRHMPQSYPSRYALVNIANATLKVYEDSKEIYHVPVVVGRPDRKTPFIQSSIRSVIFNPSWHVPSKIAREDILPKLRKDPHYLEKMGFVINSSELSSDEGMPIDWSRIPEKEFVLRLRQAPGDMNSLGRIKFDFDNDFSVYMHGTPHEELFAKAARHLSSGCIRLKEPEQFAVIALRENQGNWSEADIQQEIDKAKTRWMKIASPLPLFVIYQTVYFAGTDSRLSFADDDYNYDSILMNAVSSKIIR